MANHAKRAIPRAQRIAAAALILAFAGCRSPDADTTRRSVRSPPECEVESYPCSWAEVDVEVSRRTVAILGQALDRMYEESPTALWEWLETVPDLAEAGLVARDSTAIWFRLEGGRPAYVFGPHRHRRAGTATEPEAGPAGASLAHEGPLHATLAPPLEILVGRSLKTDNPGIRPSGAPLPDVTARDRNEDSRINQRDQRRALVMDPFYFEHCYQSIEDRFSTDKEKLEHREAITAICEGRAGPASLGLSADQVYAYGRRVKAELERIPAYQNNVTLLEDTAADHRVIASWKDYDVVHVSSHGAPDMIGFGWVWPLQEDEPLPPPPFPGAMPMVSRAGKYGPQQGAWAAAAPYFQQKLSAGLDRTFVFLAACSSMEGPVEELELIQHLSGENSGVLGWNNLVDYDDNEFLGPRLYDLLGRGWPVRQALDSLLLRRSEFVQGASDWSEDYLSADMLAYHGADLRIFEVVRLDPAGVATGPVGDDAQLNPLLAGAPGDGVDDSLTVEADVLALTAEQLSAVHVQLELDGTPVGDPLPLDPQASVGENRYRVHFRTVPLGKDLKADTVYELEAVASLPEGGESRYAVRARSTEGPAWTVTVTGGPHAGTYSGSNATAQVWDGELVRISLMSGSGARPFLIVGMDGGDGFRLGTSQLDRTQTVGVTFYPDENFGEAVFAGTAVEYGSNALGTEEPEFPPPATVEIREIGDAVVRGAVFGQFYRTNDPETGASGHSPEHRADVRIEFQAEARRPGQPQ